MSLTKNNQFYSYRHSFEHEIVIFVPMSKFSPGMAGITIIYSIQYVDAAFLVFCGKNIIDQQKELLHVIYNMQQIVPEGVMHDVVLSVVHHAL
jgi:hypothetical protein